MPPWENKISSVFLLIMLMTAVVGAGFFTWNYLIKEKAPLSPASINEQKNIYRYPTLGNEQALVKMQIFADFECHFCKQFAMEIEPQIIDQYVKTGKLKMIWRDFAFLGEASIQAAQAAHCADEQEKYFEYTDKLHFVQQGHDASVFSQNNLLDFAQQIKIDTSKFNQCLISQKYANQVEDDLGAGIQMGVKATPTVFINDVKIEGVQPLSVYRQTIENELNK